MKINKNMGSTDRIIRTLLAAIVFVLIFTNVLSGALAWVLGILAVIFLVTSFVSFCPLYLPFKFSTKKE